MTENTVVTTTTYLAGGFQYKNALLKFFPHAEGYVNVIDNHGVNSYNYVFNYTDHLGNIRVSYGVDPETSSLKIMEENHYYAFGLKHTNYNSDQLLYQKGSSGAVALKGTTTTIKPVYKYKFQGQERQDELGLNWDSFKWRNYDYAIGRFMSIDPLAEEYTYNSTYAFQENKMGMGRELEGLELVPVSGDDIAQGFKNTIGSVRKSVSEGWNSFSSAVSDFFTDSSTQSKEGSGGLGGVMFTGESGGSSGETHLIRDAGRDGSVEMMDASGLVQAGSYAKSMREGYNMKADLKTVAKVVRDVAKGYKSGEKVGDVIEKVNDYKVNGAKSELITVKTIEYSATGPLRNNPSKLHVKSKDTTVLRGEEVKVANKNTRDSINAVRERDRKNNN